jgi:ribosomal silencing factor RsfS
MSQKTEKVVVMHGFSQEEALIAMRAVKAALQAQNEVAFAMSTETNLAWKLSDLVEHVLEEHEFMTKSK